MLTIFTLSAQIPVCWVLGHKQKPLPRWQGLSKVAHTGFICARSPTSTEVQGSRPVEAFSVHSSAAVHQCLSRLLSVLLSNLRRGFDAWSRF